MGRNIRYVVEPVRLEELCEKHEVSLEDVLSGRRNAELVDMRVLYSMDAKRRGVSIRDAAKTLGVAPASVFNYLNTYPNRYVSRKEFNSICNREKWWTLKMH